MGFLPLLPWQKRHLLANFAFSQCYSIPESGCMEWNGIKSIQTAVPRQEVACVVCARKDWIEHRFRVYLWREPESTNFASVESSSDPRNASCAEEVGEAVAEEVVLSPKKDVRQTKTMNDGCFCFGDAHRVNELLATSRYAEHMPNIPREELYASSVQHPRHPEMTWLLHSTRVPRLTMEKATAIGFIMTHSSDENPVDGDGNPVRADATKTLDSRCAGVGDMDATAWCCKLCISSLCVPKEDIQMPPPALANLLWLGREHPLCQRASMGARMLSCLGRPVWRKLILGKGSHDESEKGIAGNFIFLAQARLQDIGASLPPHAEELQESFVVLFSRSIEDVKKAQALIVNRDDYLALIRLRKLVCPVYAEVALNEEQVAGFPERGVPQQLLACAQQLPEAAGVSVAQVGPASRTVDVACDAHGAAKPVSADTTDDAEWEELDSNAVDPTLPSEAERQKMEFETNTAEDIIAVDHSNDPGLLETFAAFQTKLQTLNTAAARVMATMSRSSVDAAVPDDKVGVAKPNENVGVMTAGAIAAEKEECRAIVLETQVLAKQLTRPEMKKMSEKFANQEQACVSTSGKPLSMLHPDTWSQCFCEFFYGDALPNMKKRGHEGTVHVDITEIFAWLQDREELEYTLPSEKVPYKARTTSRFDTPEFAAIFGIVKRHVAILKGVRTVFRRQGYEADLKIIATSKAEDCVEALCNTSPTTKLAGAAKSGTQRGLDQLAYASNVPENLRKSIRQVLFATVNVPFTDGYRRNLRHEGHNLNAVHGPLKIFMTANFADVYSPVLLSMILADGDGNPVAEPAECPWPASLTRQCPEMHTLQSMHRLVAQCPRTQAKFFLLMDDLVDRYLLAIGNSNVGSHSRQIQKHIIVEDDFCSSGEPGLAGFALNEMEPFEAQARGFTHGHRKVYGVPEPLGPEMLRQFHDFSAGKPESNIATLFAEFANALVECASTVQYEAATLSATQMKQEVPKEKFTPRQQELSRLDGGLELDGTKRDTLQPTPDEPLGHIVLEENRAALENRPVRNTYREVPLTGCHNSILPLYRQPHLAFQEFPMLDEFGCHQDAPAGSAVLESLPSALPWECNDDGEVSGPISQEGHALSAQEFQEDARRYALCFGRDTRARFIVTTTTTIAASHASNM